MNAKLKSTKTVVYTPESPLRHPLRLAGEMWGDLMSSRGLAWRLAMRDISAQYRQTILGYLWAILPPLVTTLLWVTLNASQIIVVKATDIPYPVFVLTGTMLWQLFLDALNAPLKQLGTNQAMLARINFPKEALVLSGLIQVLFSFFIKVLMLAVVLVVLRVPIQWNALAVVFPISGLLMLGTLIGVLLVPAGVLYKDVQEGIGVLVTPLMYLAPIVYPLPAAGALATLMSFNPLTPLLITARDLLFGGTLQWISLTAVVWGATLLLLFVGWLVYRLALPIIIERLES